MYFYVSLQVDLPSTIPITNMKLPLTFLNTFFFMILSQDRRDKTEQNRFVQRNRE